MAFSQINSFSSFLHKKPNTTPDISSTSLDYWFKFNSGDIVSNRLYNYATSSYSATVYNSASINTTTYNTGSGSLYLNGSTQYVDIDDFATSTGGITIACWIKTSSGGWKRIFDFGTGQSSDNILFSPSNGPSVYRGSEANQPAGSWGFANGNWNHLIWTLSPPTGTTCTWNIYKNGSVMNTYTTYFYPSSDVTRTNNYIGRSNWSADGYTTGYFDDFRMYSREISSSEALQLYNHTK